MRHPLATSPRSQPRAAAVCIVRVDARYISAIVVAALSNVGAAATPGPTFTITPAVAGQQLVRTALPMPRGFLPDGKALKVSAGTKVLEVGLRPLSWYPATSGEPKSVRCAMVTFPFNFADAKLLTFQMDAAEPSSGKLPDLPVSVSATNDDVTVSWKNGPAVRLKLLAPQRTSHQTPPMEIVEANQFYRWQRLHLPDPQWLRVVEMRFDALGGVTLVAHVQRIAPEDGFAPELGWELRGNLKAAHGRLGSLPVQFQDPPLRHSFTDGAGALWTLGNDELAVYHPAAPLKRRGKIDLATTKDGELLYRYTRCAADDQVPMQPMSWQRSEIVLAPPKLALLRPTLQSPHTVEVCSQLWDALYDLGPGLPADLPPCLARLLRYHRDAVVASACVGDDWGTVTDYTDGTAHGGILGFDRLNHCAAIFQDGWRSGDRRLIETALLWCDNFHDQSIWWGENKRGGTRYPYGREPLTKEYKWRSNGSVDFCTKGYDVFWLAWEQTGDPRMKEALDAQVAYAAEHLHSNQGECRNIGDARDFIRLYRYTGEQRYLDEALRLFRELRTKLSTGDLFAQGGQPIDPNPPFIEVDRQGGRKDDGTRVGYAKPYIIGYALNGLPELLPHVSDEPKLRDVVRAVATFLAESQDPVGGWRYPHPRSSHVMMHQAIEHAWQITQAARVLGPDEKFLNAIEAALRQRLHGWLRTGKVFSGLTGWEFSTGKVKNWQELIELYQKPADRDPSRDYTEGDAGFGRSSPEGLVYFPDVLAYYLQHRPASRLLVEPKADVPLGQVINRVPRH